MQLGNESNANASCWPPYRLNSVIIYDIIADHEFFYVNNSSRKRTRAVGGVSLCLFCQQGPTDMQCDLPGSFIRSCNLTRPKVKFSNWPFRVKVHMLRCVSMRGIRRCFVFFSIFLTSKVISRNVDLTKKKILPKRNIFCLTCPGKVKIWLKVVKSGMFRFKTSKLSVRLCCEALLQLRVGSKPAPPGPWTEGLAVGWLIFR